MRDLILVVGSGTMGSGIGAMSALAGNRTILIDTDTTRTHAGLARAEACIRLREQHGLVSSQQAQRAVQLLAAEDDITPFLDRARLVIEAVSEDLALKRSLFAHLDVALPTCVPICSNTSGLRITDICAGCTCPARTLTTHFWLPAHLVPLVEVVMGEQTDEAVARLVRDELVAWGKKPVLVRRDQSGQLANRIFQAIIREATDIVGSGLASAEDVDTAIGYGMAMRLPVWGPLKHLDAIGLDLGLRVQDAVLPDICASQTASPSLRERVEEGRLGVQTGTGFYDWSQRDIERDIRMRDAFIIEAVKAMERIQNQ